MREFYEIINDYKLTTLFLAIFIIVVLAMTVSTIESYKRK